MLSMEHGKFTHYLKMELYFVRQYENRSCTRYSLFTASWANDETHLPLRVNSSTSAQSKVSWKA